jgi:DNA-binding CsgD family transcriptional regulator
MVALVAVLLPPKHAYWLALLILWVAAYNGPLTLALNRADNASIHGIVRIGAVIDMISYLALLAIFVGNPPGMLIAVYPAVLIESISFDGTIGAIYGVAIFILGFAGIELAQQHFSATDVVLWSCVMVIIATSMTIVSQVMLGVGVLQVPKPSPSVAEVTRIGVVSGVPRLSAREHEVLRLVADGYSNAMIASKLHLSENTIKGHMEAVLSRLNARNRAEAVAAAGRLDLL